MKKTILALIATICSLTAIGQPTTIQYPQYTNDYLLPPYMASGCYYFDTIEYRHYCNLFPIAQHFFIDSTISIKGIAANLLIKQPDYINLNQPCYLQIRDASLNNILAQVRYDTILNQKYYLADSIKNIRVPYVELLFDNSISISDSMFYAVVTFPYSSPSNPGPSGGIRIADANSTGPCNNNEFPLLAFYNEGWNPYIESPSIAPDNADDSLNVGYELFIFPILGTISGLSTIDVDNSISIYPNPAKDEINIKSPFNLRNISIYNTLGQKVLFVETNSKNKSININSLIKGFYTIEIKTEDGNYTKKKFVKE